MLYFLEIQMHLKEEKSLLEELTLSFTLVILPGYLSPGKLTGNSQLMGKISF